MTKFTASIDMGRERATLLARALASILLIFAASTMVAHADDQTIEDLRQQIQSTDLQIRTKGLDQAARLGASARELIPNILPLIGDEQLGVRAGCVLGRIGAVDELAGLLASEHAGTVFNAVQGLGYSGSKAVLPRLTAKLRHPSVSIRAAAALSIARIAPESPESVGNLVGLLDDPQLNDNWRVHIVWTLGLLGPRASAAVPRLIGILNPPDPPKGPLLIVTSRSLFYIGSKDALLALRQTMAGVSKRFKVTLYPDEELDRFDETWKADYVECFEPKLVQLEAKEVEQDAANGPRDGDQTGPGSIRLLYFRFYNDSFISQRAGESDGAFAKRIYDMEAAAGSLGTPMEEFKQRRAEIRAVWPTTQRDEDLKYVRAERIKALVELEKHTLEYRSESDQRSDISRIIAASARQRMEMSRSRLAAIDQKLSQLESN